MGTLPNSRQESHGANSPIKGSTIDAIQDAIIGAKFSAAKPFCFGPFGETLSGTWNWNTAGTVYLVSAGGASSRLMRLDCQAGYRITDVVMQVFGDAAVDTTWTLFYAAASGQTLNNLCTGTDTNRAAAWGSLNISSLGAFTTRTMLENEALFLKADANAANYRIGNVKPIFDRL